MLLSLSLFQPKSVGGAVAKTVMLFDIISHHCQGEGKGLSLTLPSGGRKGDVVGKSWPVFVAVFHVNHLFVSFSYTFHSYCCSAIVHFLISFLFPVNFSYLNPLSPSVPLILSSIPGLGRRGGEGGE